MANSKSENLTRLHVQADASTDLPKLTSDWIQYLDPVYQFKDIAIKISASVHVANGRAACTQLIYQLDYMHNAKTVCCCASEIEVGSLDLISIDDPHKLESLDVFIAEGIFGVAENVGIWVDDQNIHQRAALFITQHLVLVIESSKIISNLTEAYSSGLMDFSRFGCWISWPSKTADIEQSLVIGAHGARTLNIIVIHK